MLNRYAWRERQRAELEYALGELSYALGQFDLIDLAAWEYGTSARIHENMTRLQARYPAAPGPPCPGSGSATPIWKGTWKGNGAGLPLGGAGRAVGQDLASGGAGGGAAAGAGTAEQ